MYKRQIAVRQTRTGQWLVCEALPHKRGIGVLRVGEPTGAHTTGFQFGTFSTKAEADAVAQQVASNQYAPCEIVEWVHPTDEHQIRFIDLPDNDAWISINPDKIVESIMWRALRCKDVSGFYSFGYDFELRLQDHPEPLLKSTDGKFRVGDVKAAIFKAREIVENV